MSSEKDQGPLKSKTQTLQPKKYRAVVAVKRCVVAEKTGACGGAGWGGKEEGTTNEGERRKSKWTTRDEKDPG